MKMTSWIPASVLMMALPVSFLLAQQPGRTYTYAVATPVDARSAQITGGFWKQRIDQAMHHGLPALFTQYEGRPIIQNYLPGRKHEGPGNQDEFLYKALEAGAWFMEKNPPAELRQQYTRIRDIVIAKQQSDGYLNTATQSNPAVVPFGPDSRMDYYFSGHLAQAGIAERRSNGETKLFDAAKAYMDLLLKTYVEGGMQIRLRQPSNMWPDHPNFEPAAVEMFRATGDPKYLDFLKRILDLVKYTDRTFLKAHGVQEMLFQAGAVDYYLERGDKKVFNTALLLWDDLMRHMYVTGSVGALERGERFAKPYDLTNQRTYSEACANISNLFWNWRMFLATGEAKYVDVMERTLYNGILVSPAQNGHEYFYVCPLEVRDYTTIENFDPLSSTYATDEPSRWYWKPVRKEFHSCSCCPPNVQRLLASLDQYLYAVKDDTVWVNLFAESTMNHALPGGAKLSLTQTTDFPVSGKITLRVRLDRPAEFLLKVRLPEWTQNTPRSVSVNDSPVSLRAGAGYYVDMKRQWRDGDHVQVSFDMPVRYVRSHPRNPHNNGKLVLARGPVVYALESQDHPGVDIFDIRLNTNGKFTTEYKPNLLGGIVLVKGQGFLLDAAPWERQPYQDYMPWSKSQLKPIEITAIPYYAVFNRGYRSMMTAVPYVDSVR
jgi:uncharacterized protein